MKEGEKKEAPILQADSFRDDWLEMLNEDRDFLSGISNIEQKLRDTDGGIRINETGKEENFMIERMRLRMIYYMATKHQIIGLTE